MSTQTPNPNSNLAAPRVLETVALLILIGVVTLRPLVSESYESTPSAMTQALGELSDATPLRTLLFDVAILVGGCLWLVSRAISAPRLYRRTGMEWGGLLIVVAAIASCVTAGNRRLAVNGAIDWLCQPLLAVVLVQTLRTGLSRRVLMAAIVATACVQAVQCWDQTISGHQQTWDHYQTIKADFWAKQGVALDSDKVTLFERRMEAREAHGFFPHPNVAGSYLVLCGLAALGVVFGGVRELWGERAIVFARTTEGDTGPAFGSSPRRKPWEQAADEHRPLSRVAEGDAGERGQKNRTAGANPRLTPWANETSPDRKNHGFFELVGFWLHLAGFLVAAIVLAAVFMTKSLGAIVAAAVVGVVWIGCTRIRRWVDAYPRRFVLAVWSVVASIGVGTVAYGWINQRLPGWSLTFRWQYWTASAKLIADHWLTGVGRENFGRHYLQYKSIQSPEEVANPHNLIVQAAADWGVLGAIGLVVLLVHWSMVLARRPQPSPVQPIKPAEQAGVWLWSIALLGVVTLVRVPLLGTDDPNYIKYSTFVTGTVWLASFGLFASLKSRWAVGGAVAGIAAFLLHDAINFAMWVPATATTLFALMGWTLAGEERTDAPPPPLTPQPRPLRWVPPLLGFFVLGIVLLIAVIPTMRCLAYLNRARVQIAEPVQGAYGDHPAWASLQAAAAADNWDPTPHRAKAEFLFALAGSQDGEEKEKLLHVAMRTTESAWVRDRRNVHLWRLYADISLGVARQSKTPVDFLAAIDALRRVIQRYPESPRDWVRYADVQLEAGEATATDALRTEAALSYEHALNLDDQRLAWEEFHRFSAAEQEAIREKIRRARREPTD